MTEFGFARIACLRAFKLPQPDPEIARIFFSFVLPTFTDFFNKVKQAYKSI